jgi:hypothetical protein
LKQYADGQWHAGIYLPPGLQPGWHDVRIRTRSSGFSKRCRIAVDIPGVTSGVEIRAACDGRTWKSGDVVIDSNEAWGYLALMVSDLAENSDRNNVRL